MNLLLHDFACAIERDCSDTANDFDQPRLHRDAWLEEWQPRLDEALDERDRELRPRRSVD